MKKALEQGGATEGEGLSVATQGPPTATVGSGRTHEAVWTPALLS